MFKLMLQISSKRNINKLSKIIILPRVTVQNSGISKFFYVLHPISVHVHLLVTENALSPYA